ncbi:MAG: hypothetical protein ACR2FO_08820 [Actinomycetota bacterium]
MAFSKPPVGAAFTFDIGVRALEAQSRRVDAIDTKAAVVLAVDGVLAGFFLNRPVASPHPPIWLALLAGTALLVSAITAVLSLWTRKYSTAPQFAAITPMMDNEESYLKWRFLGNIEEAEVANDVKLRRKVRFLTYALSSLLVEIILIGGYLIVSLLK